MINEQKCEKTGLHVYINMENLFEIMQEAKSGNSGQRESK